MKKFNPLVSIIIPVFNGSNYLESAINSALNQSYKNIEILVINDGSYDDLATERIAKQFGDQIRYFSKENGGCGSALNYGIENMRGTYFSWLSHDDLYLPNKVQTQIDCLDRLVNKNTIIFCAFEVINENGKNIGFVFPHHELSPEKMKLPLMPLLRGLIHGCALLIPKKLFDDIGIFDPDKRTTQDYALWFDFLRQTPLHYAPEVLVQSRIHSQQDTQKINALHLRECNELWSGFLNRMSLNEMKVLNGNQFGFLSSMADHLSITPYQLAQENAQNTVARIVTEAKILIILIIESSNNEATINISLQSIAMQTHQNIELAVIHPSNFEISHSIRAALPNTCAIYYSSYLDGFYKNDSIRVVIQKTVASYIAFLQAGDSFNKDKLIEQLQFMLKQDASISITATDPLTRNPQLKLKHHASQFSSNRFPNVLFEIAQFQSTLMMKSFPLQTLFAQHSNEYEAGLPVWLNLLTRFPVAYLDTPLTNISEHNPHTLEELRAYLFVKISNMLLLNSEQFLLSTNLLYRDSASTISVSDEFILHQIQSLAEYEKRVLEFWGPEPIDYSTISITHELLLIQQTISYRAITFQKHSINKIKSKINYLKNLSFADYEGKVVRAIKPFFPLFIWQTFVSIYHHIKSFFTFGHQLKSYWIRFKQLSFADYEGFVVRITKPIIPIFVWQKITSLYQKLKKRV